MMGLGQVGALGRLGAPALAGGVGVPAGFILLVDADGYYLIDSDGYYLMEAI